MKKVTTIKTLDLTGQQWIKRLEKNKYQVSNYAKQLLLSSDFKPSSQEFEIVIVKAKDVGENPTTQEIRDFAKQKGYITPPADLACILRESMSDEQIKEMGLWYIIVMHEPIMDSDGDPGLLSADRYGSGRWLSAYYGRPDDGWDREDGFAFVAPQDTLKSDTSTTDFI